jgi:hypothetical protein
MLETHSLQRPSKLGGQPSLAENARIWQITPAHCSQKKQEGAKS